MKKNITFFFFFSIVFSCNTVNKEELYKGVRREEAILNVIHDFSVEEKNKKNHVYEIIDLEREGDFYRFLIADDVSLNLDTTNIVNTNSKYYPSRYKEINNRLYVWADSTVIVTQKIIDIMDKYNAVDSTIYKIEKGLLPESEWPVLINAENIKVLSYYVCKKNVSIYSKNWGTHEKPVGEELIKKCK